ncbi:MAG TPA: sugar ABC transporter ATP-binding protein, partial [Verrucomicrobiae bacterium]
MSDSPLLEMRGISKGFPGVKALDNVSLTIGRGEVVA